VRSLLRRADPGNALSVRVPPACSTISLRRLLGSEARRQVNDTVVRCGTCGLDVWQGRIEPQRICPSCSRPVKSLEYDGYCRSCATEETGYSLELAMVAVAQLHAEVERNPRIKAARAEAERWLEVHRAFRGVRPGRPFPRQE